MKKVFNYCVYRVAAVYKKMGMGDHIEQGYSLMFVSFTFYAMALTECLLSVFNMKINKTIIILFCIPTIIVVLFFQRLFPKHQQVYNECVTKYKYEKLRWIKGTFVFLFIVMSLACYIKALVTFEL